MKTISNIVGGLVTGMLLFSAAMGASASKPADSVHSASSKHSKAKPNAAPLQGTCDWTDGDNSPLNPSQNSNLRFGLVDVAAGYYTFVISPYYPTGTTFRINGIFPDERYFSYQMYDTKGDLEGELPDYQIQPDAGSLNPAVSSNNVDHSTPRGGSYTVYLVIGPAPANPAPNTIYIDPALFGGNQYALFTYRLYNPFDNLTVGDLGGIPLPTVVEQTANGDVPISQLAKAGICNFYFGLRSTELLLISQTLDFLQQLPEHPFPVPPTPVPPPPVFTVYYADLPTTVHVNGDARYLYTYASQQLGDMLILRGKAPTYASQPGVGSDPQLRHWSMCENSAQSSAAYACIEDNAATIDSDGFFNIVMSVPAKQPANAKPAYGFDWLTWGPTYQSVLIMRNMLPSPNFNQSAWAVPKGVDPATIMGDYLPVAAYCANSVFSKHTSAGETPAQVFAGCLAGS
jgi:hypothetical protein